jgi:predicted RNA binding protein YcfA (HicA-like mRNA interferase family)
MSRLETNARKIVARLEREVWVLKEGSAYMLFKHPQKGRVTVPRHREVSPGVARSIAKAAGWKE